MGDRGVHEQEKPSFAAARFFWLWPLTLGNALFLLSGLALAEPVDAAGWLNRAAIAARQLNYQGVIALDLSDRHEFSKIVHYAQGGKEYQRTESLSGPARATIRIDDTVRSYLPDLKTMRIMPNPLSSLPLSALRRSSKSNTKTSFASYTYAKAEVERVAGRMAQVVVFTPKDCYRYEQKIWFDQKTGLLLASRTVEPATRRALARFVFVDIEIPIPAPEPSAMAWPQQPADWKVEQTEFYGETNAPSGWRASTLPPGFAKIAEETRRFTDKPEATTVLLYSDGLATVSVFAERVPKTTTAHVHTGEIVSGILPAYVQRQGDYQITAIGQVPHDTLRLLVQGLVRR